MTNLFRYLTNDTEVAEALAAADAAYDATIANAEGLGLCQKLAIYKTAKEVRQIAYAQALAKRRNASQIISEFRVC